MTGFMIIKIPECFARVYQVGQWIQSQYHMSLSLTINRNPKIYQKCFAAQIDWNKDWNSPKIVFMALQ